MHNIWKKKENKSNIVSFFDFHGVNIRVNTLIKES